MELVLRFGFVWQRGKLFRRLRARLAIFALEVAVLNFVLETMQF